ncbi:MAG TPA: PHP domain-containing protein [Candidatus Nanoarchaeia archaeon]|nr:PHP domain-containing protein [Candidatus Nanoarchaeia archaeon]
MKYDLHVHTHYSGCSSNKPIELLKTAKKKGLDGIAVVDHGSIKGSMEVAKLNKDRNFTVLKCMEISSNIGHLLAINISEEIKSKILSEIEDEVRDQDGILILAHPYSIVPFHRIKVPVRAIRESLDGIEAFNPRNGLIGNRKAARIALENNIAVTGGSDGHFLFEIGSAYTEFEGNLKKALKKRETKAKGKIGWGPIGLMLGEINRVARWRF